MRARRDGQATRHAGTATGAARRRRWATVGALAAGALTLAACGSSGAATTSGAAPDTTTAAAAGAPSGSTPANGTDMQAYRDCLQAHGVTPPTGGGGRRGGNGGGGNGGPPGSRPPQDPAMAAARQACQDKLPAGRGPGGGNMQAFAAYLSCLRDHGVNVPDPAQGGGRPDLDPNDPTVAQAQQTCAPLRPQGGPGGGRGPGGPGRTTTTAAG